MCDEAGISVAIESLSTLMMESTPDKQQELLVILKGMRILTLQTENSHYGALNTLMLHP